MTVDFGKLISYKKKCGFNVNVVLTQRPITFNEYKIVFFDTKKFKK